MAEIFRVPKNLNLPESSLTLEEVAALRNREDATAESRAWADGICSRLEQRAAIVTDPTDEEPAAEEATDTVVEEKEPTLSEELAELLADVVSFYFRAHGAHWNVVGADFAEYHKLFLDIYEDVYSSVDPLAENLRKLGASAPFQLSEFIELRTLDDALVGYDAKSLATDLLQANDVILDQLSDVFTCATMNNQQGLANFIAERLDQHQFWKWQLTSSLGLQITEPNPDPVDSMGVDEDDAEEAGEDRASAARIGEGTFVSWPTSNGRGRGKVEKVVTKGPATSSEGYTLEATPDHPVFMIRIYKESGNGWIPSDVVNVQRAELLTVTGALSAPRNAEENPMIEERKAAILSAERITMDAEVRAMDMEDGALRVAGYAATFNREATGLNFREVIAPGAFTRTLQSDEPVFLLINHDTTGIPLASTQGGTMRLKQDETGLFIEADLDPANPRAQEFHSAVKRGDMSKMSFAFTVAPDGESRSDGLRTLTDLNLFEVSGVTWPAYDSTALVARSAEQESEGIALRARKAKAQLHSLRLKNKR